MAEEIEYEAINFDGLERRANYRIIAYREDMLHIFGRKDAAAIIYHIIYRWQTEYRRAEILKEVERRKKANLSPLTAEDAENMMWVYMSYNSFVRESGHALGYNTVIRTLDYLVNTIKVFEQRENHDPRYPDYEYRINKEVVKGLIKKLPAEPAFSPKIPKKKHSSTQTGTSEDTSTQTGIPTNQSTQMGTDSTQTGIPTTQMGRGVYPNGGTSQITHRITQVSTEDDIVATSAEDRNAPAFAIQIEGYPQFYYHDFCNHAQDRGCNDGLTLIVRNLADVPRDAECQICYKPVHGPHGYFEIGKEDAPAPINFVERKSDKYKAITKEEIASHSQVDIGNDDEEDISLAETAKHKAMPKQQTPGAGSPPAATPPGGSTAASVQASLTGPPVDAAQRTASSPGTPSGAVQASIPKRPRGKVTQAPLKSPEELEQDERCKALQQRINEWRGYPLEAKGQIINERKSIRTLVDRYTDQQIEDIYVYLFTRHWKWSKPDNRYHIGAYVVLSEAQSVLQELKAPPVQNGKAPAFVIDEERNRRNIEAMKARNAARRLAANG